MVFGSKSSSSSSSSRGGKLFEQPLEKLFNPKAIKQFNETIAASNSRSPPALCQSLSAPLTSSTLTWAKLSQENSATKRKRAAARLRRFTIDANNNNSNNSAASLITTITSGPLAHLSPPSHLLTSGPLTHECNTLPCHERLVGDPSETTDSLRDHEQCRQLLLNVLPEPIRCLLNEIYLRGPSTVGIFRKSPNAKHCRELRQKLEAISSQPPVAGPASTATCSTTSSTSSASISQKPEQPSECQSSIEQFQVNVIASVFKEWLRSLPDCLLMSRLYPQWIDVAKLIEPLYRYKLQQQQQQSSSSSSTQSPRLQRPRHDDDDDDDDDNDQTKNEPATSSRATSPVINERRRMCTRAASHECNSAETQQQQQQSLSRALSCSVMTSAGLVSSSDSGRSSSSPSPSSPTTGDHPDTCSAAGDTCGPATGSGERNSRAGPASSQFTPVRQNRQHSTPRAAYLKRKCYEQQQRERSASEFAASRATSQPELSHAESTQISAGTDTTAQEICMRERRLECLRVVRQLLETLNEANLILLRAIVCVLWHIAENCEYNKMSSNNLGVCIGQSLLNDEHQQHQHEAHHGGSSLTSCGGGGGKHSSRLHTFSLVGATSSGGCHSSSSATKDNTTTSSPFAHFTKRHRRARSQCLLASTLSLTNLSHASVGSPTGRGGPSSQLTSSISSNYLDTSGAQEAAKYVPILVAFMIDNARELFGSDVMHLFGPALPVRAPDEPQVVGQPSEQEQEEEVREEQPKLATQDVVFEAPVSELDEQSPAAAGGRHENENENAKLETMIKMRLNDKSVARAAVEFGAVDLCAAKNQQTSSLDAVMSSPVKQCRRHLSTCILVHIGSNGASSPPFETPAAAAAATTTMTTSDQVTSTSTTRNKTSEINQSGRCATTTLKRRAPQPPPSNATTSILIVNTPSLQIRKSNRQDDEVTSRENLAACRAQGERHVKPDSPSSGCPSSLEHNVVDAGEMQRECARDQPLANPGNNRDRRQSEPRQAQQQQQRPLSASESTGGCSSRASSSTSGVHSAESPAFSCEPSDSSCSSSGSSTSSRNCRARTTTTCSSSSSSSSAHSSRSASISSPTSSAPSVCTSPMEIDLAEMSSSQVANNRQVDDAHQNSSLPELASDEGLPSKVLHLSHNEAMRHNLLGVVIHQQQQQQQQLRANLSSVAGHQVDQVDSSMASVAPRVAAHNHHLNHQARVMISVGGGQPVRQFERPKSMVSLGEAERRQQALGGHSTASNHQMAQHQQVAAAHRPATLMMTAPAIARSQQPRRHDDQNNNINNNRDDHLCRRTSYDAQLVATAAAAAAAANDRTNQMMNNHQSHTLGRFPARATRSATQLPGLVCPERMPKIPFQYTTSSYGGEAVLYYPASYAHMQQQQQQQQRPQAQAHQHSFQQHFQQQQQQQQQPQVPQRSHVMMLRDYYLSLQEQSQKQQQYRDFLRRQRQHHEQQSKQQMLANGQRLAPASLEHLHQSINQQQPEPSSLMVQQPVEQQQQQQQPAAVAYQRIQPRMAHIRPNQFNGPTASGLYVKQATTGTCNGPAGAPTSGPPGLLVLDRQASEKKLAQQQGVSSSASSTGHSPSEEEEDDDEDHDDDLSGSSDECGPAGEWMESTMV